MGSRPRRAPRGCWSCRGLPATAVPKGSTCPWCEGFWGGVSPPVGQQAGEPWGHRTGVKSCTDPAPNLAGCLAAHHPASTPGGTVGAALLSRQNFGDPFPVLLPSATPCTASPSPPAQILTFLVASPPGGEALPCHPGKDPPMGCPPQKPPAPCSLRGGAHCQNLFYWHNGNLGAWVFLFFLPPTSLSRCLYSFSLPKLGAWWWGGDSSLRGGAVIYLPAVENWGKIPPSGVFGC